jgi:hypothetical protein
VATWVALPSTDSPEEIDDWLGWAINRPAGQLAEFWIQAVRGDWRAAGDEWTGLSVELRASLDAMLQCGDDRAAAAEVVLGSQLHFFHAADPAWTESQLMPLFDWATPASARRAWDGFLFWGRPSGPLLQAGLVDHYLDTARNADMLRDELQRQLAEHLAAVALRSEIDPVASRWPWILTATSGERIRERWLEQVAQLLGQLPPEVVEQQWQRWIRLYWQDRVASVPTQLARAEADAMAEWAVHFREPDSIRDSVELAVARPAGLTAHSDVLHDLDEERLAREPAAYARLVTHLLRHTQPPFYDGPPLSALVASLKRLLGPEGVRDIVQEALRLGYSGAPDW